MVLKLYNTRTRRKEEFTPLDPSNVRMYVCGPTVYDYAHIGNARPIIVFDVLFRLLRHLYGEDHVTYARNITDVDDKINARAAEQYPDMPLNEAIRKVTEETAAQFQADVTALGCLEPTVQPRATEHIDDMKRMIETLVEKGCAYAAEGHVLFHVAAMKDYGQLSRRSLDEMQAGARVEVAPYKRDPMDFVLWKPSKEGEPGWPSPCGIEGLGRPGWHIECSAMSERHLGDVFDIHGGGIDLVFPHHENELAQSRCAHGTDVMANVWMHNGFLQVEGEKMSKSLGNFLTINELLQDWPGEVLRLAMLKTHYREPINWTAARLEESWSELEEWITTLRRGLNDIEFKTLVNGNNISLDDETITSLQTDLNTPRVITRLRKLNKRISKGQTSSAKSFANTLVWLGLYRPKYHFAYLSLSGRDPDNVSPAMLAKYKDTLKAARVIVLNEYDHTNKQQIENKLNTLNAQMHQDNVHIGLTKHGYIYLEGGQNDLQPLIEARLAARKAKNWAEADRIRDELAAQGILLKDAKDPETGEIVTTWEIAR